MSLLVRPSATANGAGADCELTVDLTQTQLKARAYNGGDEGIGRPEERQLIAAQSGVSEVREIVLGLSLEQSPVRALKGALDLESECPFGGSHRSELGQGRRCKKQPEDCCAKPPGPMQGASVGDRRP